MEVEKGFKTPRRASSRVIQEAQAEREHSTEELSRMMAQEEADENAALEELRASQEAAQVDTDEEAEWKQRALTAMRDCMVLWPHLSSLRKKTNGTAAVMVQIVAFTKLIIGPFSVYNTQKNDYCVSWVELERVCGKEIKTYAENLRAVLMRRPDQDPDWKKVVEECAKASGQRTKLGGKSAPLRPSFDKANTLFDAGHGMSDMLNVLALDLARVAAASVRAPNNVELFRLTDHAKRILIATWNKVVEGSPLSEESFKVLVWLKLSSGGDERQSCTQLRRIIMARAERYLEMQAEDDGVSSDPATLDIFRQSLRRVAQDATTSDKSAKLMVCLAALERAAGLQTNVGAAGANLPQADLSDLDLNIRLLEARRFCCVFAL